MKRTTLTALVTPLALLALLTACGSPGEPRPTKNKAAPQLAARSTASEPARPAPTTRQQRCVAARAAYKKVQLRLNYCQRDNDCAEIYPGPCPGGPYYVHRNSDAAPLLRLSKPVQTHCDSPDCGKPTPLGIASCRAGRCVKGRVKPKSGKFSSCWDYELTYLQPDVAVHPYTEEHHRGITPRLAVGVAVAGTMEIRVTWPRACKECRLDISEHNSGMANLKKGSRKRTGDKELISLPVSKGLYYLLGRAPKPQLAYTLTIRLVTRSGKPTRATHRGVAWQRLCEG